jgi:hypothetical protein
MFVRKKERASAHKGFTLCTQAFKHFKRREGRGSTRLGGFNELFAVCEIMQARDPLFPTKE